MRNIIFNYLLFVFLGSAFTVNALEVDEKLTIRLLNASTTKKTLLINRGLEDGLVKGDHAKLFDETGVFARGVIVKVSPTRSVWSLYQLIRPDAIEKSSIANLKISTPVKVTKDKTKMLSPDNKPESSLIPLSPEAYDDPNTQLTEEEQKDLASLEDANIVQPMEGVLTNKDYEWYSLFQFDGMTSSSDLAENGTATGTNSTLNIRFGIEKYFSSMDNWLKNWSIDLFGTYSSKEVSVLEGSQSIISNLAFGGSISFHHISPANSFGRLIGFGNFSFGLGRSEDAFTIQTIGNTSTTQLYEGSMNFISLGYGMKYYTFSGIGFRAIAEFYRRGETYDVDTVSQAPFSRTVQGPRFQVGLSYRW
tara:strand:+ start:5452 stop:6540 length:1089 start_codon:yes stop_codon:yes gene_type:complete